MTVLAKLRYAHQATHAPHLTPADIGRAATLALHDELELAPKPGLVSFIDSGSHDDMDAHTFMQSLFALRHYFVQIAALGEAHAPFEALERCGIAAEARMLAATGGINTHRGAIFTLGLLCASAGALVRDGQAPCPAGLRAALHRHWGDALHARSRRVSMLPGGIAARRYGLRSASEEAALGFPVLFDIAVPAIDAATKRGLDSQRARLDTLFAIMASLDDSNLAHRGGLAGLQHARHAARGYLERGGAAHDEDFDAAWAIHRDFVARRLSPGGAADTLAAACWIRRICARLA
ncbi:triphosphoribosyl-dephospho-CoA synthase [Variovorax sp. HW608]|uniref:triphosphoribosyl-dephospho-CoA synthase MdcB n=1 Tax=Variovorax sp. HW608 TaxID=1034889 RepID=UPI00082008E6|nr:triphosphoribosyl-dephospho-CoA synthase MdcB [Variovorax sp. HW608]SCK41060.1 triphosphoribosyl-dephospho-CoA synthase [Variovorax sp. HW608]